MAGSAVTGQVGEIILNLIYWKLISSSSHEGGGEVTSYSRFATVDIAIVAIGGMKSLRGDSSERL